MGEMVMAGYGQEKAVRCSISFDTPCGLLLHELEQIWTEIGEREQDKDRMFLELETECMRVYRRKVDSANSERVQLRQSLMAKEAELKALMASIGENTKQFKVDEKHTSLKEQLATVTPLLEDLRAIKEERIKQFSNVQFQIEKINAQISDYNYQLDDGSFKHLNNDHDLSTRRLADLQMQLRNLQKEKSDRLQKVFIYVDEVHCLCAVLGMDFAKTVKDVHPSLHGTDSENSTNISDSTLEGLTQTILKLKAEKRTRVSKLQEIVEKLHKLWNLMESTEQERRHFAEVAAVLGSTEEEITSPSILSSETIQETGVEVERLTKQKASRMKELVLKRRLELENICRSAHMEPDMSTAPEKIIALIDSGLVDPCELLSSIEAQIAKANEESQTRKDIMERVDKWLSACDEETWLEEYNQDDNRYSAGRGAHLNLKRAEKARMLVQKIPTMIDNLIDKTFAWEDESNTPFLYDGVRLVAILEEQKLRRVHKEEDKRRHRDQKKLPNARARSGFSVRSSERGARSRNRGSGGAGGVPNGALLHISHHLMNMMPARRRKTLFPVKPRPLPQHHLLAGIAAAFAVTLLFIILVLLSAPPSSPPSRDDIHTRSTSSRNPPRCGATGLGEFGDMMVSMLPRDLAFTVFVPSPGSFRRVLKLRPNDSVAEGKASDTYAVVSRVLSFSAVPRRLRSADVPLRERVRLLVSVSGLRIYAWRDVDGVLVANGVRSECVDIIRDETVVHVMAGVLMDAEFERSFPPEFEN